MFIICSSMFIPLTIRTHFGRRDGTQGPWPLVMPVADRVGKLYKAIRARCWKHVETISFFSNHKIAAKLPNLLTYGCIVHISIYIHYIPFLLRLDRLSFHVLSHSMYTSTIKHDPGSSTARTWEMFWRHEKVCAQSHTSIYHIWSYIIHHTHVYMIWHICMCICTDPSELSTCFKPSPHIIAQSHLL